MNIIKLYTYHGPIYIDSNELNRGRTHLTIYTKSGEQLSYVGKTSRIRSDAAFGVHKNNLFASKKLAEADRERIYIDMFNRTPV